MHKRKLQQLETVHIKQLNVTLKSGLVVSCNIRPRKALHGVDSARKGSSLLL